MALIVATAQGIIDNGGDDDTSEWGRLSLSLIGHPCVYPHLAEYIQAHWQAFAPQ